MIRLLGLVLVAFLIWVCLEAVVGAVRGAVEPPSLPPPEPLARCGACGVYFPRARALARDASAPSYCSEECLRRGAAASS